jgi:hypothetical protein
MKITIGGFIAGLIKGDNVKDFQENVVPALQQNSKPVWISENTGLRITFAGNSITKHAPKPDIGWDRDCGMAAS